MSCAYSKLFVSVAVVQIPSCSRVLAVQYDIPMSHVRTLGIVRSMKSVEDQDVLQDELLKRVYCPISHFHVSARLRIELQAVCRHEFSMW